MEKLISVIVPIYKVEEYLNRCVESIVNQTYKNLEIILVDDGSPDQCPEICDQWEKKDTRIRVIHKQNGGLSDARNAGMKIMNGEYVAFVDSDDWLEVTMYEKMVTLLEIYHADICECGFQKSSEITVSEFLSSKSALKVYDKIQAMKAVVEEEIQPVVWNKIYKTKLIKDLHFVKGKYNEDEYWTYLAVDRAKKIIKVEDAYYHYFFRENSIINETYSLRRLDGLDARYERMKYLQKYPEIYTIAKQRLIFQCMYHYQKGLKNLSGSELKQLKARIRNIFSNIPITKSDVQSYSSKEKVWYYLGKISLDGVCKIRNRIGRGI